MSTMHTNPGRLSTHRRGAAIVLATAVIVAACSAAASPAPDAGATGSPPAGVPSQVTPEPGAPTSRPPDLPVEPPQLATVPPGAAPITGEVPGDVIAAVRGDLATRIPPTAADSATVVRAEAVEWSDGSLGCPVPGELYPQVVTPGYWVVLEADGAEYDYRATATGVVKPCSRGLKPNPGG